MSAQSEQHTEVGGKKNLTRGLLGQEVLVGFPSKGNDRRKGRFFELFFDTCYSDKLYSVQIKDFPENVPAVYYVPGSNYGIDWHGTTSRYELKVPEDEAESLTVIPVTQYFDESKVDDDRKYRFHNRPHVFVVPSPELIEFLKERGINLYAVNRMENVNPNKGFAIFRDRAWSIPEAFDWYTPDEVPQSVVDEVKRTEKKKSKTWLWLLAAIAIGSQLD